MDPWQQSVENRLGQLDGHILDLRQEIRGMRSDMGTQFRWLLGVLVVIFGALLAAMAKGFGWL